MINEIMVYPISQGFPEKNEGLTSLNRHYMFLCRKAHNLETLINKRKTEYDYTSDQDTKDDLYSEVRKMEKALSCITFSINEEKKKQQQFNGGIFRRTFSIRNLKPKTKTVLISNDGLQKKRKAIKNSSEYIQLMRMNNSPVIIIKGGRKTEFTKDYKYSSGMNIYINGKSKRIFNNISKTELNEDVMEIYHQDMMIHFPQDNRMMEKEMKLKTLRFAESVCGYIFNNQKMTENGKKND